MTTKTWDIWNLLRLECIPFLWSGAGESSNLREADNRKGKWNGQKSHYKPEEDQTPQKQATRLRWSLVPLLITRLAQQRTVMPKTTQPQGFLCYFTASEQRLDICGFLSPDITKSLWPTTLQNYTSHFWKYQPHLSLTYTYSYLSHLL